MLLAGRESAPAQPKTEGRQKKNNDRPKIGFSGEGWGNATPGDSVLGDWKIRVYVCAGEPERDRTMIQVYVMTLPQNAYDFHWPHEGLVTKMEILKTFQMCGTRESRSYFFAFN